MADSDHLGVSDKRYGFAFDRSGIDSEHAMNTIESDCLRILDRFRVEPSVETAKRCMMELAEAIGPGFHPDTKLCDYVLEDGSPTFEEKFARRLDSIFERVLSTLVDNGIDPCEVAFPVQLKMMHQSLFGLNRSNSFGRS